MTTKIDTITSDVQTTFTATPTIQTEASSDNSTKLASIGYVSSQSLSSSTYLDKTSTQTVAGTYSLTNQPTITTIDTPTEGTLNLGDTTDTSLTITYLSLTIKGFLQNLAGYLAVGNLKLTPAPTASTGTYVDCQKIQTGQVSISGLGSLPQVDVTFNPAFTSTPSILLSVQGLTATAFTPRSEYVTNASPTGFKANYNANPGPQTTTDLALNWMAIGT
jgi:hypothetical protein